MCEQKCKNLFVSTSDIGLDQSDLKLNSNLAEPKGIFSPNIKQTGQ
jgi:hypothetical protein